MTTPTITGDVRARRLAAGLTQLELAERAGCGWSTIRLFDRGYVPAHSDALERVLAVLDEAEAEVMAAGFRLKPGLGVSGYRGDTDGPGAA